MILSSPCLSSSRGQRLIQSNDAPDEAETVQLATELKDHKLALSQLPVLVSRNGGILERLLLFLMSGLSGRRRLETTISQYQAVLAPIRRLPIEILCQIFMEWIYVDYTNYAQPLSTPRPPWTMLSVCRNWRNAGLADPQLWSSYLLEDSIDLRKSASRALHVALDRSRDAPLNVVFNLHLLAGIPPPIHVLIDLGHRFHRLEVRGVGSAMLKMLERLKLPQLRELDIGFWDSCYDRLDIFRHAPKLRQVTVRHIYPDLLTLPWTQITHFCWYGRVSVPWNPPPLPSLSFLAPMTNLETLELYCSRAIAAQDDLVSLKRLKSLVLSSPVTHTGTQITAMESLYVPALQYLTLTIFANEITNFLAFQQRSQFHLTHLTLNMWRRTNKKDDWVQLFEAVPELVSLRFTAPKGENRPLHVDGLAQALSNPEILLPILRTIYIEQIKSSDDFKAFLDMVALRTTARTRSPESVLGTVIVEDSAELVKRARVGGSTLNGISFLYGGVVFSYKPKYLFN